MAIKNDQLVGEAWVGHPYYEVIDNSSDFENKMRRLTKSVADKLGVVNAEEWLDAKAVKLKFLVKGPLPDIFPVRIRDFTVHHDYLPCSDAGAPGEDQTARQTRQVDVHPHSQEAGGRRDRGDQDQRIPTHLRPAVVPGNSIICPSENCCITLSAGGQRSKCLDREDPAMLRLSFLPISERCLRVGVFSGQSWKL